MNKNIEKVLRYFFFFSYLPTFEEIYTFYPKRTTKKNLNKLLLDLERKKKVSLLKIDLPSISGSREIVNRYSLNTLGEYSIKRIKYQKSKIKTRWKIFQIKLAHWRFRWYIRLLSLLPQIKLIGLSGSMAMINAKEEDDIDLFIITAKNRLFTARFLAIILAKLFGIHRGYGKNDRFNLKNKVCLNLFFETSDLKVPDFKQNEYVAHEVLQMKPLINKDQIYERFLAVNQWVFKLFPNAKLKIKDQKLKLSIKGEKKLFNFCRLIFDRIGDWLEKGLKNFQLFLINRHKTTEIITSTQLWFHPDDFGRKIKKMRMIWSKKI